MAEQYELSSELLDTIFTREIVPTLFRSGSPSTNPTLILVGAQPGAGKSRVNVTVMSEHPEPVVAIIGDDLRIFHPSYADLVQGDPSVMPDATAQASGQWVERSIAYAAENGISVLVEGTFRRPEVTLSTAHRFKERGFRVQVVLLAVSPEVSRLSIARRYLRDVETSGHGRFTSLAAHDAAYDAMPDTIKAIAAAGSPVDELTVRTRDQVLMVASRNQGKEIRGVRSIVEREWDRPFTDDESAEWMRSFDQAVRFLEEASGRDPAVGVLSRQLEFDRQFIHLNRGDRVAVRGHVREGGDVTPHERAYPKH